MINLHFFFQHGHNLSRHVESDLVGRLLHIDPDLDLPLRGELLHVDQQAEVVFDWHHIVWTQNGAESVLYVDGVADTADFNLNAFAPTERFSDATAVNTTSIGGIRRGAPSHWITGLIDDVAIWKRTLSADEVTDLFTNGLPTDGAAWSEDRRTAWLVHDGKPQAEIALAAAAGIAESLALEVP